MKKLLLALLIIFISVSVFAEGGVIESGSLNSAEGSVTNVNAKITYSISTTGDSAVNSYKIGFCTNEIDSLEDTPVEAAGNYTLKVADGEFAGKLTDDVYVFWQIASTIKCDITLTPSAMSGAADGNEDKLHITFKTTNVGTPAGATAYGETNTKTESTSEAGSSLTKTILTFTPAITGDGANNNQAVGSQKIEITTDNLSGLTPDSYSGTLTLNITAKA